MTKGGTFGAATQRTRSDCSYTSYGGMTRDTIDADEAYHPGRLYANASMVLWVGLEHTFRTGK